MNTSNNPFHPSTLAQRPIIAVCGAGTCNEALAEKAEDVGRQIARAGAVLACGGLGGVMEAACRGAHSAGGFTLGLLPGTDCAAANPFVHLAIPTGMGHARNVILVQTADVVLAIGGAYGTLSEIALARKTGRQVIGLDSWDLGDQGEATQQEPHIIKAATPTDAVALALRYLPPSRAGYTQRCAQDGSASI